MACDLNPSVGFVLVSHYMGKRTMSLCYSQPESNGTVCTSGAGVKDPHSSGPSPGRTAFAGCTPAHLPTLLASFPEKLLHGDSLHKAEYSHRMKTYLDLGLVPILLMTG